MKQIFKGFLFVVLIVVVTLAQNFEAGKKGVVVSASKIASDIGIQIMKDGGNSVDAAVAVSFALSVVWPEAGNIGGGGFMVIRFPDGNATTIDYREKAPMKASRDMYLDSNGDPIPGLSTEGPLAAGVPGTVAGMALAWEKYGLLPWNKLLQPAVELAEQGFPVTYHLYQGLKNHYDKMAQYPSTRKMFFPYETLPEIGEYIKFPQLAATLRRISENGADDFYRGLTALKLVRDINSNGGIINYEDLKKYRAMERDPITFSYRDHEIISMAPPSSGGLCMGQILKIVENYPMGNYDFFSKEAIHKIVEAERFTYANRSKYFGDPDFVNNHAEYFLSDQLNDSLAMEIKTGKATESIHISPVMIKESEQTTHFSIIDENGMAVSNTTTLNSSYGSKFVSENTGILLNNEMNDFSIKAGEPNQYGLLGSDANAIAPGKKMLSSMTPTIVVKDGNVKYILGTPGGATIITTVTQTIINLIDYNMDIRSAVQAPRFHHQWYPDKVYFEEYSCPPTLKMALENMGYQVVFRSQIGDLNAIEVDQSIYKGVADIRRQSAVSAY